MLFVSVRLIRLPEEKKDKKYSGTKKSTDEKKSSGAEIKEKVQEG